MHPRTSYALHSSLIAFSYGLTAPTYVPFLLKAGLTLAEVPLVNAFFFGVITLMELPTGLWADGRSRLLSIRLGTIFGVLSLLGYATASGFWSAVTWEAVGGLANAFLSGANAAWLTDALAKRGEQESLRRSFATTSALNMLGLLSGGIVGARIGAYSFVLVWIAAGFSQLAALAVASFWMNDEGEPEVRMTEPQAFAASWRALKVTPSLRWVVAVCVVFGLVLPFNYYWSPFYARQVGIAGLSWIWMLIYGVCALAGFAVRSWKSKWGADGLIIPVCLGLSGIGMAGASASAGLTIQLAFTFLHEFGRGALNPLTDAYTQARIESQYRATFGSLMSLLARGGYTVVLLAVWTAGKLLGGGQDIIAVTWLVSGLTLAALAAILWLTRPRHDR